MTSPASSPEANGGTAPGALLPSTASLLVERAAELFARKGFSGTSIREIAAAAGVTKPTLYYYFGSKDGLVRHIIQAVMGELARQVAGSIDGATSLKESLVEITRAQLEYADSHPASVALVCRLNHEPAGAPWTDDLEAMQREVMSVLCACFEAAQRRGEILHTRRPQSLALGFLGSLFLHTVSHMKRTELWEGQTSAGIAEDIVALFLGGACAPAKGHGEVP